MNPQPQQPNAQRQPTAQLALRKHLEGEQFQAELAKVIPRHMTAEWFVRVVCTTLMRTPQLAECTQESFFQAMLTSAQFGLPPDGRRAHLIPYRNNKTGKMEVQLIFDYKGIVELVMRSGTVSNIHADVVCENDEFEYNLGEVVRHKIDFRAPRGKMYAAYAICRFRDGTVKAECMTRDEIDAIKARSKAGNFGPWVTDYSEMAKKGLAIDTPIPTPYGWRMMGHLHVGDLVYDCNGSPTEVIAVSDTKNIACYLVTMSNNDAVVCDCEHRWLAKLGSGASAMKGWPVIDVVDLHKAKAGGVAVTVPVAASIAGSRETTLDPWLLGYWLGNGSKRCGVVTAHSDDAEYVVNRGSLSGFRVGAVVRSSKNNTVSINFLGLKVALRELGVLSDKHIPDHYLRAETSTRAELLKGLMDSDGCVEKARGRAIFTSCSKRLAEQAFELVCSLGEVPNIVPRQCRGFGKTVTCYFVEWQPVNAPVGSPRKLRNFRPRRLALYRSIKSIKPVPSVPTRCIAVDSPTKTYLCGRSFIVTHNTVFRRLSKWLPLSPEVRDAVESEDDSVPMRHVQASVSERASTAPALNLIPAADPPQASPQDAHQEAPPAQPEPPARRGRKPKAQDPEPEPAPQSVEPEPPMEPEPPQSYPESEPEPEHPQDAPAAVTGKPNVDALREKLTSAGVVFQDFIEVVQPYCKTIGSPKDWAGISDEDAAVVLQNKRLITMLIDMWGAK